MSAWRPLSRVPRIAKMRASNRERNFEDLPAQRLLPLSLFRDKMRGLSFAAYAAGSNFGVRWNLKRRSSICPGLLCPAGAGGTPKPDRRR